MTRSNRIDRMLGYGTLAALVIGCLVVLLPFVTALLLAVILTYSTWPSYVRLRKAVGGRSNLAAGLMMLAACPVLSSSVLPATSSRAYRESQRVDAFPTASGHSPRVLPASSRGDRVTWG